MSIGMHTLDLAKVLVVEKRLEAELPRRWRIKPAAGISARATPEPERANRSGRLVGRQPRQA
ncbi:MAG: hypothetical protein H6Q11_1674 [Acidobacteria bacterium]|jgi:hypothetical protein|nr:hypothetical protein [Acidobacteriota bacterium]